MRAVRPSPPASVLVRQLVADLAQRLDVAAFDEAEKLPTSPLVQLLEDHDRRLSTFSLDLADPAHEVRVIGHVIPRAFRVLVWSTRFRRSHAYVPHVSNVGWIVEAVDERLMVVHHPNIP